MSQNDVALSEQYAVDVKLVGPLIEAVQNTLRTQCQITAKLGAPTFKDTSVIERTEVIICAAIATENLLTNFALCFEKRIFLHLMGKMLGESYSSITPELEDGAKEMMNVVFNQAKKPLAQKGLAGYRSVPQVIFGEGMRIRYLTRGKSILLPFETEMGSFWAEITTQNITISDKV